MLRFPNRSSRPCAHDRSHTRCRSPGEVSSEANSLKADRDARIASMGKQTWGIIEPGDLVSLRPKRVLSDIVETRVRTQLERNLADGRGLVDEHGKEYREWHYDLDVITSAIELPPLRKTPPAALPRSFKVRPARQDEAETLASLQIMLWRENNRGRQPNAHLEYALLLEQWRTWLSVGDPLIANVAVDGDVILGFAAAGRTLPGEVRDLELLALYVVKSAHGTDAGQLLLDATLTARPALVWVPRNAARATSFLERNGFAADGAIRKDPAATSARRMLR